MRFLPKYNLSTFLLATALLACAIAIAARYGALGVFATAVGLLVASVLGLVAGISMRQFAIRRNQFLVPAAFAIVIGSYFVSYGPATWLFAKRYNADVRSETVSRLHQRIYEPVTRMIVDSPDPIHSVGVRYVRWWMPPNVKFRHRGRYIGWDSQSSAKPSLGLNYRMPCSY
ncbi:hypothetical protein [Rhodopirellula bahusiensis]|uniref:hypothetical protein n=1 Tax=Rhodopirellula bahusiensis TaxID=2014065 RepID=UPI00326499FF